jgi:hypothetical protein
MHGVFKIHLLRWSEEGEEEAGLRKKEERRRGRKRWENYNGDGREAIRCSERPYAGRVPCAGVTADPALAPMSPLSF